MLIKDILGLIFIALGLVTCMIGVLGVFRFNYVLNRMHAAAMLDTLGLFLVAVGGAILFFSLFPILKITFVVVFLWLTSPVSSHLIARVESLTNRHLSEHLSLDEQDERKMEL